MADTIKNNQKVAVMIEAVEGTYQAPANGDSFISPLADSLEINPTKERLERNNLNSSIGKSTSRGGMQSVSAAISVEAKANGIAGAEPEYSPLLKAALGTSRQNTTVITSKASGNTATVLQIEDADISKLNVGDTVLVKQAGAFHLSPILSKTTGTGTASVTLLIAHPSGDMTDSVQVEKFSTYYTANSGHPTLSVSKYVEDARLEKAIGCRVASFALNNFTTGQLADFSFSLEGLGFDQALAAPGYTPSYDSALPPKVLSAFVYQDNAQIAINELTFNVENSLAYKTSTASENGRISSRITERVVSGSINPYKQDNSLAQFNKFKNETEFSVFGYMAIPTATGEYKDVVAFYMPKCVITEYTEADQDGLLQENLAFNATRGADGSNEEIFITII